MKRLTPLSLFLSFLLIFHSCSEEPQPDVTPDPVTDPNTDEPVNHTPLFFLATVSHASKSHALIKWRESKDIDKDTVYYKVFLNGVAISSELTGTTFPIEGLKSSTAYKGHVEATDKKSDPVIAKFSFTTQRAFTTFNIVRTDVSGVDLLLRDDGDFMTGPGLSRFDSLGNVKFANRVEPPSYGPDYTAFIETRDGDYLFANRFQIQRFSEDGVYRWTSEGFNEEIVYNDMIEISDGSILAVGNGVIQKFSAYGRKRTTTVFDPDAEVTMRNCTAIVKAGDGGYLVAGSAGYDLTKLALAKLDAAGNIVWVKNYSNGNYVYKARLVAASDGTFTIGANTVQSGEHLPWILNITGTGTVLWERSLSFAGNIEMNAIIELNTGEYMLAGSEGYDPKAALLVKLTHGGDMLWYKRYVGAQMDYQWRFTAVRQTPDGGLLMIGGKKSIWGNEDGGFWMLKTDSNGKYL
jgi:hypothetical protein